MTKSQQLFHLIASILAMSVITIFALWWINPAHIPKNFSGLGRLFDLLLFVVITYIVWHPIAMEVLGWSIASHIKNRRTPKPKPGLKVAFITTFVPGAESRALLDRTLPAMMRANYEHDTWLLDEGNDPEVMDICKKYGVNHFSRFGNQKYNSIEGKFAKRTKGGNHNSWYDTIGNNYEFVAQLDTDFIPKKNFLTATLGFFENPDVAFVGTPQVYGNSKKSLIAKGAAQQTFNFYGPILRGMDGMNTTLLIGANHIIRVSALRQVDHYSAHITEDLLTGMKLHAAGWQSIYVPKALAIGEGPTTWKSYFDQQKRWAYGCMHILFNHSPKLLSSMNNRRSLYYFFLQQHYFSGVAMGLSVVCLSLYFGFGIMTAQMNVTSFLSFYLPTLLTLVLMSFWMQRFNVRPKNERGIMWAGAFVNLAVWPIFFIAFVSLFKTKKLVYVVTRKGERTKKYQSPIINLFIPHLIIAIIGIIGVISSYYTDRHSALMLFWAGTSVVLMSIVPVFIPISKSSIRMLRRFMKSAIKINSHYRILEFTAIDRTFIPTAPTVQEKYLYSKTNINFILWFSVISFITINISLVNFLLHNPILWPLIFLLSITAIYFLVSLLVSAFTESFSVENHKKLVRNWRVKHYPSVDIFLPTAGESIDVIRNTWEGVRAVVAAYKGHVSVYSLDDGDSEEVQRMANEFGYKYVVRENRGYYKKAGNLRNGYNISKGEYIAIFDADFKPRADFLKELLPYFKSKDVGIVQSPQYFNVNESQNWLERGAGAVQELFYRYIQHSRQQHSASICVGSNAIYRRSALDDIGGTALIEHSEDVHTGFNIKMHGWKVQYVPIILAKGLCPASMSAFFKQQYRWCMGSLSLLTDAKFWSTKLGFRERLSYISGFLYYVHTGLTSFYTPLIPLILLLLIPSQIIIVNYLFILPTFVFTQLIYPLWHKATYGIEAWATRSVYGWAHLFAIWDKLTNNHMQWSPTGLRTGSDRRYVTFRILQIALNLVPAIVWVFMAAYYALTASLINYSPILISGVYYLLITCKVSFYISRQVTVSTNNLIGSTPKEAAI